MAGAIAPITGMLRKRFTIDVAVSFAGGIALAELYWCVDDAAREADGAGDQYYAKLNEDKKL
ncbi:hypothetical protein MSPP1_000581 [Malassezia sp. CBS 17886]|nr:hypothetical protein MSPP1_000581 [Malassezia sp. CBS 17886]